MSNSEAQSNLVGLVDRIRDDTDGGRVSVGELMRILGHRTFGSALVLAALLAILPTGAIPGMSVLTGLVMLLVTAQLAIGRDGIWLPGWLTRRTLPRGPLVKAMDKAHGWAEWLGRFVRPRLEAMVSPPLLNIVAALGIVLALTMFPLAVVPFGAFPAAVSFIVLGTGLVTRDGLLVAAGGVLGLLALGAAWWLWPL